MKGECRFWVGQEGRPASPPHDDPGPLSTVRTGREREGGERARGREGERERGGGGGGRDSGRQRDNDLPAFISLTLSILVTWLVSASTLTICSTLH